MNHALCLEMGDIRHSAWRAGVTLGRLAPSGRDIRRSLVVRRKGIADECTYRSDRVVGCNSYIRRDCLVKPRGKVNASTRVVPLHAHGCDQVRPESLQ